MSSHDTQDIIARLTAVELESKTRHNELKALYAEVKALRNNYKNNNKIVTALKPDITQKLETLQEIVEQFEYHKKIEERIENTIHIKC